MINNQWVSDFFVLRTPLFSIDRIVEIFTSLKCGTIDLETIISSFLDEKISEAIYLASPILYNQLIKFRKHPATFSESDKKKLIRSIFKYYIRACSRSTPFGLFANCRTGFIGDLNYFRISDANTTRYLRLDMDALCHLGNYLKSIPQIRERLIYYPNSTIYRLNNDLKYIEYKYNQNGERTFHLSKLEGSCVLNTVLRISKVGKLFKDLCSEISKDYNLEYNEVSQYIYTLIDNNVLYSNIEPNVTGDEYFSILLRVLKPISKDDIVIEKIYIGLCKIEQIIQKIRNGDNNISLYNEVYRLFKETTDDIRISEHKLFQLDISKHEEKLFLNKKDINKLCSNIQDVLTLNSNVKDYTYLEKFKKAFKEKYEDQIVKLVELFDNETGMGYRGSQSISDFYETRKKTNPTMEVLVLKKYCLYLKNGAKEIELTENDFNLSDSSNNELPDTFSIMANVIGSKESPIFSIMNISPSTTNLLGRFCHADSTLFQNVKGIIEKEKNDDYVIAEIAHLPQARIGNILSRPVLTDFEITFLASSTLNSYNQIKIDDLYVRLCGDELILFSKRLKKRVIPRLSSAHNFSNGNLDIYHFLSDLQYQGYRSFQLWDWGIILESESFLPRVMYKNCILSPARWKVDCTKFRKKNNHINDTFKEEFLRQKSVNKIPDIVFYKEADNYLLLDLSLDLCIDILQKEAGQHNIFWLYEYLFLEKGTPYSSIEDNQGFKYANEIILPVTRLRQRRKYKAIESFWLTRIKSKRTYYLGESWLFLKIYGKPKNYYKILSTLYPLIQKLIDEKSISLWFFIYYADPYPHIRIRLFITQRLGSILERINQKLQSLLQKQIISNIMSDTYKREIERYGDDTMNLSEYLFYINSEFVYEIIKENNKKKINIRIIAISIIEKLLSIFDLTLEEKCQFLNDGFMNFGKEFDYEKNKELKKTLQKHYREIKNEMDILIDENKYPYCSRTINNYIEKVIKVRNNIHLDSEDLFSFLKSHIHMYINRLFFENQRYEEFTCYYFLDCYYRSLLSRKSYRSS